MSPYVRVRTPTTHELQLTNYNIRPLLQNNSASVCVYYCRTYYKAVRVGGGG